MADKPFIYSRKNVKADEKATNFVVEKSSSFGKYVGVFVLMAVILGSLITLQQIQQRQTIRSSAKEIVVPTITIFEPSPTPTPGM